MNANMIGRWGNKQMVAESLKDIAVAEPYLELITWQADVPGKNTCQMKSVL